MKKGNYAYMATLLWQWRSDRPRHLVLSLDRPPAHLSADSCVEDVEHGTEDATASGVKPSYTFGRLFLRPINVAQLLAVLVGWATDPVRIERRHTTLSLIPDPSATSRQGLRLSSFLLQGTFTTKSLLASATTGSREEGHPGSVYNDEDIRAMELRLDGSELVLLTTYLEGVLSDCFGIEHVYHRAKAARQRQGPPAARYRSQQRQRPPSSTRVRARERAIVDPALSSAFDFPGKTPPITTPPPGGNPLPPSSPAAAAAEGGEEEELFDFDDSPPISSVEPRGGAAAEAVRMGEIAEPSEEEVEVEDDEDVDVEWQEEEEEDLEVDVDFDNAAGKPTKGKGDLSKSVHAAAPAAGGAMREGAGKSASPITSEAVDAFDPVETNAGAGAIEKDLEVGRRDATNAAHAARRNDPSPPGGALGGSKKSPASSAPIDGEGSFQKSEKAHEVDIIDMQHRTLMSGAGPTAPKVAAASEVGAREGGRGSTPDQTVDVTAADALRRGALAAASDAAVAGSGGALTGAAPRASPADSNNRENAVGKGKSPSSKIPAGDVQARSEGAKKRKGAKKSSRGKANKKDKAGSKKRK
ncbi:unnamed protein product [Phytomonas sp. EM1]|nr:unnamed protein product [Phytomonas sp. EM1]|eukprot:CCW60971.1 unnamed protein product [Phytomonas sp. isolate EM1]